MTHIKICGITEEAECDYLNKAKAEYAGIVLYNKSKRYVTPAQVKELVKKLNDDIIKVAVVVSPTMEDVKQIEALGFDRIQIHGELGKEVYESCNLSIWRALNIDTNFLREEHWPLGPEYKKIEGIVFDAKNSGKGITFDWSITASPAYQKFRERMKLENKLFILAGGLNVQNVADGIEIFEPDVVDVSSGVENDTGKDSGLITDFVRAVKKNDALI